jgi:putative transposase
MKNVSGPQVVTTTEALESPLPAEIQEALGELVGAAREGLLALSVGVGLRVVHELMEAEVTEIVGPRGKHDPERTAKRHGHEDGSMTLGGRRVAVSRPRMRTADDQHELVVASYEYFAGRDPLQRAVMDRMLAGVSTRKFARVAEPVGEQVELSATSTRKSTVSEMFIEKTRTALGELMARRLDDVRLAVMMLDGLEIAGRVHVVALGVTTEGVKVPLGLWEGSTENATLARSLLADLVDRGLDPGQAILFVLDGGKALRRAIKDVFGEYALVHRCHRHKERNVLDLLPERDRPRILARIRGAWALKNAGEAETQLEALAAELERSWPDAAASLREGMTETLTLMRLGITGRLAKSLSSTNPIESMIEIVRHTQRNVKRWQDGDMRKRWTAAGMLQAEQQFRRVIGYTDLSKLVIAIERRHLTLESQTDTQHAQEVTDTTETAESAAQLATV